MEIRHYTIGNILVLELKGELKNKSVYKMKPFILEVVTKDCKKIILDMKEVQSVDVSWCDYLIRMYRIMQTYGRQLVIANCPDYLSDNEYAKKVMDLYPFYASLEEALVYFQPGFVHQNVM